MSKNTLSKWRHGQPIVRVDNARSVAQALGVDVGELLGTPFLNGQPAAAPRPDLETFARDVASVERPSAVAPTPDLMDLFRDAAALIERMESVVRATQADNAASHQLDQLVSRAKALLERGSTDL